MPESHPLPSSNPEALGFALKPLEHLDRLIREHIEQGRYPGAQIALARNGQLALFRTYGDARTEGGRAPASGDTLFLLFSQTKVLTSAAVWTLVEEGRLSFMDKISDHLPEFAARGKGDITLHQVMTHQGGFPSGDVSRESWADHARMRAEVCDFSLDWTPGTRLQYHPRAAHLVQAMVIEAVTGRDYRDVIRDNVLAPLGLGNDVFVGVPSAQQQRCADTYAKEGRDNSPEFKAAGLPSGGGYRDSARHGGVLPDAARPGQPRRRATIVAAARRLCNEEPYRRTRRRRDGRHPDASRSRPACARRERPHPRPRHDRRAADFRAWRRWHLVFLGRPDQRRVVYLLDELHAGGPLALGKARPRRQSGARGDRLSRRPAARRRSGPE